MGLARSCRSRHCKGLEREADGEPGTLARGGFEIDGGVMGFGHGLHRFQAEPGAAVGLARAEEWFEDALTGLRVHATAGVGNGEVDEVGGGGGADGEGAAAVHGGGRVGGEVEQGAAEEGRVEGDLGEIIGEFDLAEDAAAEGELDEGEGGADDVIDIGRGEAAGFFAEPIEEAAGRVGGLIDGGGEVVGEGAGGVIRREDMGDFAGLGGEEGEQIVPIVRQIGRQAARSDEAPRLGIVHRFYYGCGGGRIQTVQPAGVFAEQE